MKIAVLNLYNAGAKSTPGSSLNAKHMYPIAFDYKDISKLDTNQLNFQYMLDVFYDLDKSLGNKVRKLFGEQPIEDKSAIGKVWDKTKGMFGGNKKGASQNINLNESSKSFTNGPAPQAGGNNLNFDQSKVNEIDKLLPNVEYNGQGGTVEMLKNILHKVNPDKKGKYDTTTGRRHDLLLPLAKYLKILGQNAKTGDVDKYCKDTPDENWNAAEKLVCKVRNVVQKLDGKGYGLPKGVNE